LVPIVNAFADDLHVLIAFPCSSSGNGPSECMK